MARVFIGVGSNIDPESNVQSALKLLGKRVLIVKISTFYRTQPLGRTDQPSFYNGAVEIETVLPPDELKRVIRGIEADLGRVRTDDKYAPRTIDLDILIYDDAVISSTQMTVPDPEITERAFLAVPLCELSPDLILPGTGLRICDIADSFGIGDMEPLPEFTALLRGDHGNEQ